MALSGKLSLKKIKNHKKEKYAQTQGRPKNDQLADIEKYLAKYPVWVEFKPLELGVYSKLLPEIRANVPDVSGNAVRRALNKHTNDLRYHRCVVSLKKRYSLNGDSVCDIEQKHIEFSKGEIKA